VRASRRSRGEAGATTEMVIVFPALLLLVLLGVQFALWFHASHVALAAAQEGARVARTCDRCTASAATDAGDARANQFLDGLAPTLLADRQVSVRADHDHVRVDVSGRGVTVLPGFAIRIHEHSEGAVERFRAATEP
jgi:Flp pilus assembly protein TadG